MKYVHVFHEESAQLRTPLEKLKYHEKARYKPLIYTGGIVDEKYRNMYYTL